MNISDDYPDAIIAPQDPIVAVITDHAYIRAKERLSLAPRPFTKLANKAYSYGVSKDDCSGRLFKYIQRLWDTHRSANNVRIYGEVVFLFDKNVLITVFQIPTDLKKSAVSKSNKKRKSLRLSS